MESYYMWPFVTYPVLYNEVNHFLFEPLPWSLGNIDTVTNNSNKYNNVYNKYDKSMQ